MVAWKVLDESGTVVYWIKGQEQLLDADNNKVKHT